MKFFILFLLLSLFMKVNNLKKHQINKKKQITMQILQKLENFITYQKNNTEYNNSSSHNISKNIKDHLNIEIKHFGHKHNILPKFNETVEYFLNYCEFNASFLKMENLDNFNGLKALTLDLYKTLNFFIDIFLSLQKTIVIPPPIPHDFLKKIYPKFYLIYFLFFDFCKKSINHGLFDPHFPFKKVISFIILTKWLKLKIFIFLLNIGIFIIKGCC